MAPAERSSLTCRRKPAATAGEHPLLRHLLPVSPGSVLRDPRSIPHHPGAEGKEKHGASFRTGSSLPRWSGFAPSPGPLLPCGEDGGPHGTISLKQCTR